MGDIKYYEARMLLMNYLKQVMKEKGITQQMIADKTGFSQVNISRILAGKYPPNLDNFIKICDAVNTYFFIIDKDANDDLTEMMRNRWNNPPMIEN